MKRAHIMCFASAIAASAAFITAGIITFQMFYFDAKLRARAQGAHGGKLLEAYRAYQQTRFSDTPAILFLGVAGIVLGILAIRFYNHSKSEFFD
ncbi:MAG TPA: hypothetical protein VG722_07790 [Tepidisphaeraceae bacterium]|nr:hypothetical protein [Tepidisphaeraceae bacterium]